MTSNKVLFTGPPGCGKSTLIEEILRETQRPSTGFFTREMREKGRRVGFSINTLDGEKGILAHQSIRSKYRVGKYGVNLADIDQIAVPAMIPSSEDVMVVIDEIGKMECFSHPFRNTVIRILNSVNPLLGSIPSRGSTFIEQIKKRRDILLIEVSEKNRNSLAEVFISCHLELRSPRPI